MRSVCYTRKKAAELLRGKLPPIYTVQKGHEPPANQACDSAAWRGWWVDYMGAMPVVEWWVGHSRRQAVCMSGIIQYHTPPHSTDSIGLDTASPMT